MKLGRPQRIVWGGGLLILVIVGLAAYDIHRSYRSTVSNTARELETQARIIAEQTARTIQAVDVVLRNLQEQSHRGALATMSDRELHAYLRDQAIGLVQVDGLVVARPSGLVRATSLAYPLPRATLSVSGYPVFDALRDGRDPGLVVTAVVQSEIDREWILPVARRLSTPSGQFAGGVGARGKVAYFERFYRDLQLEPGSAVTLIHLNGTLVARHPAAPEALGKRLPLFDEALRAGGVLRNVSPLDGVERFGVLKLVADYPLAVVVTRDVASALEPWRVQARGTALRTLALAVLAAVLLVLVVRQFRRLNAAQERFSLAVAGSDDGIWDYDFVNRRVFASARAREISAMPPGPETQSMEEWLAAVPIHPEDAPKRLAAMEAHLAGKTPTYQGEYRMLLPDGNYRWVRVHGLCVRDENGKPLRMAGSTTDIDARKRAEEALRASEEQYREIFNAAADAFVLRDADARVVDVNPAFLQISGYSREEVVEGKRWIFALPEMRELATEMHRRTLAGESVQFEMKARRKDGKLIDIEMRAVPVIYRGKPHALGMARDITAQKRAEAERLRLEGQLLQSKKLEAIGTLAGGIAHDFNNILAAILGYGEMAQKGAAQGTPLRRHVDQVVAAGMRAKSLVERILAFSRSGVGERAPVRVQQAVAETLDLVAASLPAHVDLVRRLKAEDAAVLGDATQIHQVVMNLCTNAAQAMKAEGPLTVELDVVDKGDSMAATSPLASGRYVRLRVSDTGTGIPANLVERIFDPFFTTKEIGVGTGLGLSMVHGIVTDLGGGIEVESRVGHGTTFTVYLPWLSAAEAVPAALERAPRGNGETILLVDDEEALVRLGEEALAELGYEPAGFTSAAAALEAFRASPERFDIVLSDESMPEITGSELAAQIRAIRPGMPILLMSGFVTPALNARAQKLGGIEVLGKPLVGRDLARALARIRR